MKWHGWLCLASVLMAGGCGDERAEAPAPAGAATSRDVIGYELVAVMTSRGGHDERVGAAKELANTAGAESLIVLMLMDRDFAVAPELREISSEEGLCSHNRSWLYALSHLVENLPKDCSPAIAWALAHRLDDQESGELHPPAGEAGLLEKLLVGDKPSLSYYAKPFREYCRDALVRRYGSDFEYEKNLWRQLILAEMAKADSAAGE